MSDAGSESEDLFFVADTVHAITELLHTDGPYIHTMSTSSWSKFEGLRRSGSSCRVDLFTAASMHYTNSTSGKVWRYLIMSTDAPLGLMMELASILERS